MLHHIGLYIHVIALLLVGGGSIGSIIIEKQLWIKVSQQSPEARVLLPALSNAKYFILAGIILFLSSGLIMLASTHWVFLTQGWFIAKFLLFLSLPLRAGIVAGPLMAQIEKQLSSTFQDASSLMVLKKRLSRFHVIQYCIVSVIVFLVIFKV